MNRYFALEIGYQNFGDFEQNFTIDGVSGKAKLSADGYTFGAVGSYPLGEHFEVFGRAGAFFWDGEAEINNTSQADPGDTNPYFGAGLGYRFTDAFSVSADWTRYDLEDTESDVLSVGVRFRFGR
jgi:OOP family OmpA-OmpF porin